MSVCDLKINRSHDAPIGIFDSGIGGLSVLYRIKSLLPFENIYYLNDPDNAPYGSKCASFIAKRSEENVRRLIKLGCKLIVVACNTATAVSVEDIRKKYDKISIVGLEPAIHPAVKKHRPSDVLVLATPLTLSQKRFINLREEFESENDRFVCVPLQKTVSYVEEMTVGTCEHISYLKSVFSLYCKKRFHACVLGCTHFPFAKKDFSTALGYAPEYYEGGEGSAKRVKILLSREGILNKNNICGKLMFSEESCKNRYSLLINNLK